MRSTSLKAFVLSLLLVGVGVNQASAGHIIRLFYDNITGTDVNNLVTNANFPNNPDDSEDMPYVFRTLDNTGDNYGSYIRGYIQAPLTGNYKFFISSDDSSRLNLSTDENPANLVTNIAHEPGCCNGYIDDGIRSSVPIPLVAGKQYYVEVLHKEGGGGDYVGVGWLRPDGVKDAPLSAVHLSPWMGTFGGSNPGQVSATNITAQPFDTNVIEATTVTFFVNCDATPPTTFQWYKNGVAVPGANLAYINVGPVKLANNNDKYSVAATNGFGGGVSAAGTLTVTADTTPPALSTAITHGNPNGLEVIFSKSVDMSTATNKANYSINNGVTISSIVSGGPDRVELTTSTIAKGAVYTVTVSNVKDLAQTPNLLPPNSAVTFLQVGGTITHRFYQLSTVNSIADVTNSSIYPNNPTFVTYEPYLEYGPNGSNGVGNNYGNDLRGFITPLASGSYTFYISSDDQSTAYLSTDENPANATQLCVEPVWNNARQWKVTSRRNATAPENISAAKTLTAGKSYFVYVIHREGGGGDSVGLAWEGPNLPTLNNGDPPIGAANLSPYTSLGPVVITNQPPDQTVAELNSVTLSAGVDGTPPYLINWTRNGTNIPGANATSYTFNTTAANNGDTYAMGISNAFSSAVSRTVKLTVTVDHTPPTIVSATGSGSLTNVTIVFSKAILASALTNTANYAISGGLSVASARAVNASTVLLQTSRQTSGTSYTVTINNITDTTSSGNKLAANATVKFTGWVLARGGALREQWNGSTDVTISSLTNDVKYIGGVPDSSSIIPTFETNLGQNNYGDRITALLYPPVTGDYTFYIATDDYGTLYLSTDDNPANLSQICFEPVWNGFRAYTTQSRRGTSQNESAPVTLTAGKPYYIELLHKQGIGGDNESVTWVYPGTPPITDGQPPIQGAFLATYVNPDGAAVTITANPKDTTVQANTPVTFTAAATGTSVAGTNVVITWQRAAPGSSTFTAIPGITGGSYTIPFASLADNVAKFEAVATLAGVTATSTAATLTVTADTTPPKVVYALSIDGASINVFFSEPIDTTSGNAAANYKLDQGATVSTATVRASNPQYVDLVTSPLTVSNTYTLTITGVKDTASPGNSVAAGTTVKVAAQSYQGDITILPILPLKGMLPLGSKTQRGFYQRFNESGTQPNSIAYAEQQLAGLIGPNTYPQNNAGQYTGTPISTNIETGPINYNGAQNADGTVPDQADVGGDHLFPGEINGTEMDNFAMEADAFVQLTAGIHHWGVNSDDGFQVSANPTLLASDPDQVSLGIFNGGRGSTDSPFWFVVPQDGLYPIRLVYEEGGGGFNCEMWEKDVSNVDPSTGPWYLINGSNGGPAAFVAIPASSTPPPALKLTLVSGASGWTITWSASSATLQSATAVTGPWADVTGATSPTTLSATGAAKFYRLKQ